MASAAKVTVGGRELGCKHCAHALFFHRTAALDRVAWGGLLHLEGIWGQHTDIYVCARCGFAHFFMPVPGARAAEDARGAEPRPEPVPDDACLSCGKTIPANATKCLACGWSWAEGTDR
jgi:hypothetical protein